MKKVMCTSLLLCLFLSYFSQNVSSPNVNQDNSSRQNPLLVAQLDSIYRSDQKYRKQMDSIRKKFGWNSEEMKALTKIGNKEDSLNLIKVSRILDTYGWLGPEVIGEQGNSTLFLVIQHSNQSAQEKYLPLLREAVKNKKARGSSLALMEDRVALGQGKMQMYGSQLFQDSTGAYVDPIEDVDHLDQRRAAIGLPPMAEYVKRWKIEWNVETYKKDLPNSPAYRHWLAWREELERRKR
jgi:hypothetical protein